MMINNKKTIIILNTIIFFALISTSGCSSYLALTQPGDKNLLVLEKGTDRSTVIREIGQPSKSTRVDGKINDEHKFIDGYSATTKTLRGLGHFIASTSTGGIWELAGMPLEDSLSGEAYKISIKYDDKNKLISHLPLKEVYEFYDKSKFSAGVGSQFAIAGLRYDVYRDYVSTYIALGLPGVLAGGVEVPFASNKASVGATIGGGLPMVIFGSGHVNYYFNNYRSKGLIVGLEGIEYAMGSAGSRGKTAMLSLGYKY